MLKIHLVNNYANSLATEQTTKEMPYSTMVVNHELTDIRGNKCLVYHCIHFFAVI